MRIILSNLCVLALLGCQNQSLNAEVNEPMQIVPEVIYKSHNCSGAGNSPGAQWIASSEQYASVGQQIQAHIVSQQGAQLTPVDFTKYGVVLVNMGQQRTGGYGLTWDKRAINAKDNILELELNWIVPKPGMMVTQMLSSPCIMLKIPIGSYSKIIVKDQHGMEKAHVQIP